MSTPNRQPSRSRSERTSSRTWPLRVCGVLFLSLPALAQGLVNGGVVHGAISAPGERDVYTFDALERHRFELRAVDPEASTFSPQIEVYGPAGALVATRSGPNVAVIDTVLVQLGSATPPGRYTVVVSNAGDAREQTGTYDLYFVLGGRGESNGTELFDGVTVIGEISGGELDVFSFTSLPGQPVEGTVTDLYGGTLRMRVETFGDGSYSSGIGPNVHFSSTDGGGGKTLVVSDARPLGMGTGRYSIVLHGIASPAPYAPSVFLPGERESDPLLLDNAGHSGLGPRIGDPQEPFNVSIDCTGADFPSYFALYVTANQHGSPRPSPWGWFYIDGPNLLMEFRPHTRSIETWFPVPAGMPLPSDPALVGRRFTVQGAVGGIDGSIRMSNAITQTIGG